MDSWGEPLNSGNARKEKKREEVYSCSNTSSSKGIIPLTRITTGDFPGTFLIPSNSPWNRRIPENCYSGGAFPTSDGHV
jgi:hypothetical protein